MSSENVRRKPYAYKPIKRALALFLSLLFAIGHFVYFSDATFANPVHPVPPLQMEFSSTSALGPSTYVRRHTPATNLVSDTDQIQISWPLGNENYSFRLEFPIPAPTPTDPTEFQWVVLDFIRTGFATAWVTYRIYDEQGGTLMNPPFSSLRVNEGPFAPGASPNFTNAALLPRYVETQFFLADELPLPAVWPLNWEVDVHGVVLPVIPTPAPGMAFGVHFEGEWHPMQPFDTILGPIPGVWGIYLPITTAFYRPPIDEGDDHFLFMGLPGTTPSIPLFGVSPGTGFSFSYDTTVVDRNNAHNISFLWSPDGNTFTVTTGGFPEGGVYPFHLSRWSRNFPNIVFGATPLGDWPAGALYDILYTIPGGFWSVNFTRQVPQDTMGRVFTGLVVNANPIARHRDAPRYHNPPYHLTEPGVGVISNLQWHHHRDPLFYEFSLDPPIPAPQTPLYPASDPRSDGGYTNWDLHYSPLNLGGVPIVDANPHLWHPANRLDHRLPLHDTRNDNFPAVNNMVLVSIRRPIVWRDAVGAVPAGFVPQSTADSDWQGFVQTGIVLDGTAVVDQVYFHINNLFGPTPTHVIGVPTDFDVHVVGGMADRVDVLVTDLPGSVIFDESFVTAYASQFPAEYLANHIGATVRAPIRGAYTFQRFVVEFHNNEWHVRVQPYRGHVGTYWLVNESGNVISAPVLVPADHDGSYIFMPFAPLAGGIPENLQVIFIPYGPAHFPNGIHSQVMTFRATPDRMMFTAPGNFVVTPPNPNLYIIDPENPDWARFDVTASWDVQTIGTINQYFEFINLMRDTTLLGYINEIVMTFQIRSRPTPYPPVDPNDDHPYVVEDVDIRIIREEVGGVWTIRWEPVTDAPPPATLVPPPVPTSWPLDWVTPRAVNPLEAFRYIPGGGALEFGIDTVNEIISFPFVANWFDENLPINNPINQLVPINFVWSVAVNAATPADVALYTGLLSPLIDNDGLLTLDLSGIDTIHDPSGMNVPIIDLTIEASFGGYTVSIPLLLSANDIVFLANFFGDSPTPIPAPLLVAPENIATTAALGAIAVEQGGSLAFFAAPWHPTATPPQLDERVLWRVYPPVPGVEIDPLTGVLDVDSTVPPGTWIHVWATAPLNPNAPLTPAADEVHSVRVTAPAGSGTPVTPDYIDDMLRVSVPLSLTAGRTNTTPPDGTHFRFPEIYFWTTSLNELRHRVPELPYPHLTDNLLEDWLPLESNSAPVTLDRPGHMRFPPPQNLRLTIDRNDVDYRDNGFFDVNFDVPTTIIDRYIGASVYHHPGAAQPIIRYRVFISENPQYLRNLMLLPGADRAAAATNVNPDGWIVSVPPPPLGQNPLNLSGHLTTLRSQGILMIEMPLERHTADFTFTLPLEGLDPNRRYYAIVDSYIYFPGQQLVDPDAQERFPNPDFSTTTSVRGVTTWDELTHPDPSDFEPPAPSNLEAEADINSVLVSWDRVPPLTPEGSIRYEVIRIRGTQIPIPPTSDVLDNNRLSVHQFLDRLINDYGITSVEAGVEVRNDPTNPIVDIVHPGLPNEPGIFAEFEYESQRARLLNTGLAPNTLYFYYVRTVWYYNGVRNYSVWRGVSATTSIVEPPINLRVIQVPTIGGESALDGVVVPELANFDPRTQFVIRFDVPLEFPFTGIVFEYSLREDNYPWQDARTLTTMIGTPVPSPGLPGHYQLTFLVYNLLPGRQYSIRVRIRDTINEDFSQYSNIATTRTDSDQDAIDRDRDSENLLQYLRDLLARFARRHYWIAQNNQNTFRVMYRPSMMNNLLETNGSMVRLAMSEQDVSVFYLPQTLFLEIWRSEQGFVIERDDMEISIPHRAFNDIDNEAILLATRRIRDVREIADYYVRITAMVRPFAPNLRIHGTEPAGQEVTLRFEVVEARVTARQLDLEIAAEINYLLDNDRFITEQIRNEILRMIDRGDSFEDMTRRVRQMAETIEHQMSMLVDYRLRTTLERIYEVRYVSQPVTIRINNQPTANAVEGFQFAGGTWVRSDIQVQGNARVMRTNVVGSFAFTANRVGLPGLTNMQGHETLTQIIVRNNLHDFLGSGDAFNMNANISLSALQGVAARLAGAPAAANPQNWLRNAGYFVPVRGAMSNATTQEAIYMIMAVYEMRSGNSVASVRISNFNNGGNISGVDARYRTAVAAAFELGIFTNTNMNPNAPISVEEVLRMILAVNRRTPL